MKVRIEFLLTHTSDSYDIGRVPCIGEQVFINDACHEVTEVIHILDPGSRAVAIVRVK